MVVKLDPKSRATHDAMLALAALRYYAQVFPDDVVPFRAVAALLSDDVDTKRLGFFRSDVEQRSHRLGQIVEEFNLRGGAIVAAYQALLTVLSVFDANPLDEPRTHFELAKHAMERGIARS